MLNWRQISYYSLAAAVFCCVPGARADSYNINGEIDTLTITLDPSGGAVSGDPGSVVGWGFTVNWSGTNNWISFTGTTLGAPGAPETNSSLLDVYTDFIGANGGPDDGAVSPATFGNAAWTEMFNSQTQSGFGSYAITSDPNNAVIGAQDSGEATFMFDVYSGNPADQNNPGTYVTSLSYHGPTTAFSVTVTPEPGTLALAAGAAAVLAGLVRRRERGHKNL